jgi:hypothetical protein
VFFLCRFFLSFLFLPFPHAFFPQLKGALCFVFPPDGIDEMVFNRDTVHRKYLMREEKERQKLQHNQHQPQQAAAAEQGQKPPKTRKQKKQQQNAVKPTLSIGLPDADLQALQDKVTAKVQGKKSFGVSVVLFAWLFCCLIDRCFIF